MVGRAPPYTRYNLCFLESTNCNKWDEELRDLNDEVLRERRNGKIPDKDEITVVRKLGKIWNKCCGLWWIEATNVFDNAQNNLLNFLT